PPRPPTPTPFPYTTLFRSSSVNIAADRAAVSAIEAKLSGVARLTNCSETPSRVGVPVSRAASATRTLIRISEFILKGTHLSQHRSEEHTSELQSRFDLVCR